MTDTRPTSDRALFDACVARLADELGQSVGAAAARIVVAEMGGGKVYIPSARVLFAEERNRKIRRDYNSGWSYAVLASEHGLHRRTIRRIVHGDTRNRRKS